MNQNEHHIPSIKNLSLDKYIRQLYEVAFHYQMRIVTDNDYSCLIDEEIKEQISSIDGFNLFCHIEDYPLTTSKGKKLFKLIPISHLERYKKLQEQDRIRKQLERERHERANRKVNQLKSVLSALGFSQKDIKRIMLNPSELEMYKDMIKQARGK